MIAVDPAVIRPEQRLADRVVEALDLAPPVNIRALVADHADIDEFDDESSTVDAVVHGLAGERERPLLLLNTARPDRRIRFTLAHEGGHLLLPWHIGTIECQVGEGAGDAETSGTAHAGTIFRPQELEADSFAARLLVPHRFLAALPRDSVPTMLSTLADADVSAEAGVRSLASALPPGYVFVIMDAGRRNVYQWFSSYGTASKGLSRGRALNQASFVRGALDYGETWHQGRPIAYARFPEREEIAVVSGDWRSILTQILSDLRPSEKVGGLVWNQINGVAASANSSLKTSDPARIAAFMRERYLNRGDFEDVVQHELFTEYVQRRALAFVDSP